MATTKPVIRNKRINPDGLTPIYIRYTHNQKSILFAVNQSVKPEKWDDKGCCVNRTMKGYSNINMLIDKRKQEIDKIRVHLQIQETDPTIQKVREEYDRIYKDEAAPKVSPYILDHWDSFIQYQKINIGVKSGTLRQYTAAKNRLVRYEKEFKTKLSFDSINSNFYDNLLYFLYTKVGLSPGTVGGQIKNLKSFLNFAVTKKALTKNECFRSFSKPKNSTQIFTLTHEQLDALFFLDLSFSESLQRTRDLFCLCCVTGLRYSDAVRLQKQNIKSDHIIINTKKTDDTAIIPLNDYSRRILGRYPDGIPGISNQKMNSYLKKIGKLARFTEEHEIITFKFGIKKVTKKPLHKLLTSHMARRTFITQSLERGMLPKDVMKLSTHRDMKAFQSYINVSEQRLKQEVGKAWDTLSNQTNQL